MIDLNLIKDILDWINGVYDTFDFESKNPIEDFRLELTIGYDDWYVSLNDLPFVFDWKRQYIEEIDDYEPIEKTLNRYLLEHLEIFSNYKTLLNDITRTC